jgi:class 3 adenylate cyclase
MKASTLAKQFLAYPCWRVWGGCLLLLLISGVRADTLHLDASTPHADLANISYLLEDPTGVLTLADVQNPKYAARFQQRLPNIGFTASAYWLRFSVVSKATQAHTWWFASQNRTLQEIALYWPNEQGVYQEQSASSTRIFANRPLPTMYFTFPLTLLPQKKTDIYLRIRSTGAIGVIIAPGLWQAAEYKKIEKTEKSQWFIYLGVTLSLGLFNLLLCVFLKDQTYLLYVAALLMGMWAVCSATGGFGSAFEYFWPNSPLFEESAWTLSIVAAAYGPVRFLTSFVGLKQAMPHLYRLINVCIILIALLITISLMGTLVALPNTAEFSQKAYIASTAVFGVMYTSIALGLCMLAWQGNRQAIFLCVAWLPVIFFITLWSIHATLGRTFNISLVAFTSAFELILMSLALADRFNQEKKAKALAQTRRADVLRKSEQELETKVTQRTQELQKEQNNNRKLLHNIMPIEIAAELSKTGSAKPALHESVTILFTDFKNFTQITSTMPPDQIVAELGDIFTAFDDITDACGVEKIKTIGDAYMAVAGLPKPCKDHAQRCVRAGLKMIEYLRERNEKSAVQWAIRIGIHSGPVVAGVVGKRKFAFDIWGDTVNVAARVESAGDVGQVNISAYTCDLIQREFECEYRGKFEAKGKGEIDMYFVKNAIAF